MRSAELGSFFVGDNGVSTYNYPVSPKTVNPSGPSLEAILTSKSASTSPTTIPGTFETSGNVSPALSESTVIPPQSLMVGNESSPSTSPSTSLSPGEIMYDMLEKAKGKLPQGKLDQITEASAKAHPTAVNFSWTPK